MKGRKPKTVQEAVIMSLEKHGNSDWPVSVAETVRDVRAAMSDCDLTDEELSDLVTIAAMERGRSITFDSDLLRTQHDWDAAA